MIGGITDWINSWFPTHNKPQEVEAAEEPKDKEEESLLPELREDSSLVHEHRPGAERPNTGSVQEPENIHPIQPIIEYSNLTLEEAMTLFRIDAIAKTEAQVREEYVKLKKLQNTSNTLSQLLNKAADGLGNSAGIDTSKDLEFKQLLDFANEQGIKLPKVEGTIYKKEQLDSTIRNTEQKVRALDTDIKLHMHNAEEGMRVRNQVHEMLNSVENKRAAAIQKIIRAISGNG